MKTCFYLLTLLTLALTTSSDVVAMQSEAAGSKDSVATSSDTTMSEEHQRLIDIQGICPVTGEPLGSMGDPVKVSVEGQLVFLCCKACVDKQIQPEHWKTILQRQAKAQGLCPIMEKPVDATMKSTVVEGVRIFVCCPPCIEKIQADPKAAFAKITPNFDAYVSQQLQEQLDQSLIQVQQICPVTGAKLGSMGTPVKVKVGPEETAFLCCKGCIGKDINAQHWQTVQKNLAAAQKKCLVMGEFVDTNMKSVVVEGRKIFVCCPPCIEKIKQQPQGYLKKLQSQLVKHLQQKDEKSSAQQ